MTATWPTTLPQCFTVSSYEEETADNLVTSETSVGPDKIRRRSTADVSTLSGDLIMTNAQCEALRTFVKVDLAGRSRAFFFPDQRGGTALVRLADPLKIARTGPKWVVRMKLEVLP